MMRLLRAAEPVVLSGVIVSAVVVLVASIWFIDVESLTSTDKAWADIGGAFAMAFFAFMVGMLSAIVVVVLARWLPIGLLVFGAIAIGLGIHASILAVDYRPELAPLFIVLHAVFVAAFGIMLPLRVYEERVSASTSPTPA